MLAPRTPAEGVVELVLPDDVVVEGGVELVEELPVDVALDVVFEVCEVVSVLGSVWLVVCVVLDVLLVVGCEDVVCDVDELVVLWLDELLEVELVVVLEVLESVDVVV